MGGQGPTLGGFQQFLTSAVGVPVNALPTDSPVPGWAYDFALDFVNCGLQGVPSQSGSWTLYAIAVYNLAADTLINWMQDTVPPVATIPGTEPPVGYWTYLRQTFGMNNFVAGVVQSTNDQGTGASYMVPKTFEGYTIGNLQNLKTPYGRQYLAIASSWGTLWGLT